MALTISELASLSYIRNDTSYRPQKRKVLKAFAIVTIDGIDQIETTEARAKRHARELQEDSELDSVIVEFPNETAAYEWADTVTDSRRWLSAARAVRKSLKSGK